MVKFQHSYNSRCKAEERNLSEAICLDMQRSYTKLSAHTSTPLKCGREVCASQNRLQWGDHQLTVMRARAVDYPCVSKIRGCAICNQFGRAYIWEIATSVPWTHIPTSFGFLFFSWFGYTGSKCRHCVEEPWTRYLSSSPQSWRYRTWVWLCGWHSRYFMTWMSSTHKLTDICDWSTGAAHTCFNFYVTMENLRSKNSSFEQPKISACAMTIIW